MSADPDMRWQGQTFEGDAGGCSGVVEFDEDDPYAGQVMIVTCADEQCTCAWVHDDGPIDAEVASEFATFDGPDTCRMWADSWDSDTWNDDHETIDALADACGLEPDTVELPFGCSGS